MIEKIEEFLKNLTSSLQVAKIYTINHPRFNNTIDQVYDMLQDILSSSKELVIGIVGEELAYNKEIFFELSRKIQGVILFFKEIGIEKLCFYQGVEKKELIDFILCLIKYSPQSKVNIQDYISNSGIRNITTGKIKISSGGIPQENMKESLECFRKYEDSFENIMQSLDSVLNNNSINYQELKFTMADVMENIITRYKELLRLSAVKKYDVSTFTHIFNVSVLSMHLSSKLGFSREDVLNIGLAALFHDIGKLYISRNIVKKADKLTTEEFSKISSHTVMGSVILLNYVNTLGILPVVVAFEHHLKYDGSGYPKLEFFHQPHVVSKIVSICDVYDALTQRRSYKRDYPPDRVFELMLKEKGRSFDPVLLDKFFEIMGVWPVGTIVVLSNDAVAIVREQNEGDIFSPQVEIISSQGNRTVIDLKQKTELKIVKSLNPLSQGKDFVSLI